MAARMVQRDVDRMLADLRQRLLALRDPAGGWRGCLSSSALSTAVAAFALAQHDPKRHASLIERGLQWLATHRNTDGGWGDTDRSPSNLSTTALAWAACTAWPDPGNDRRETVDQAEQWLIREVGSVRPDALAEAILQHYGGDRTFSVPILTMLAIAGRLGTGTAAWRHLPPLPFELAAAPRTLFRWLQLPVVSYALPALIGMGLARHACGPRTALGPLRRMVTGRALGVLTHLQPAHGGFLEAAPLTAFVVMGLCAAGHARHPVAGRGCHFLEQTVRADGSWAIDTDLATWVTSLSVAALASELDLDAQARGAIRDTLKRQQFDAIHPFTAAAPGGWAWTDLPGGTPDADDTAAALVALHRLGDTDADGVASAVRGIEWLIGLQNRDGGIPTFCKGWGRMPFDRSCPDITAHAVRAMDLWCPRLPDRELKRAEMALKRMLRYLAAAQRGDGAWVPLWFGNAMAPGHENPVYGTARVLMGLESPGIAAYDMRQRGCGFLRGAQGRDGGWGADLGVPPSVEETALAVSALAGADDLPSRAAMGKGGRWLLEQWAAGPPPQPTPIGLYFASLWYYEELYPLIFSIDALRRWTEQELR